MCKKLTNDSTSSSVTISFNPFIGINLRSSSGGFMYFLDSIAISNLFHLFHSVYILTVESKIGIKATFRPTLSNLKSVIKDLLVK